MRPVKRANKDPRGVARKVPTEAPREARGQALEGALPLKPPLKKYDLLPYKKLAGAVCGQH